MKGKWKYIYLNPIVWFLIIWLLSLGWCEMLTLLHGKEFLSQEVYDENTMIYEIGRVKVLSYTKQNARVYIISKNNEIGDIIRFVRKNGEWKYSEWEETVWSFYGNADNRIWPYWWHGFRYIR